MSARARLPNRRPCESFELEVGGLRYKVTAGYFPDGSLAEIFVSNHKVGNASDIAARDGGILVSLCLQHGVPLQTIKRALTRNADGSASGVIAAALDPIAEQQP